MSDIWIGVVLGAVPAAIVTFSVTRLVDNYWWNTWRERNER